MNDKDIPKNIKHYKHNLDGTITITESVTVLNKEEAQAIIQELSRTFIDRDNPLCNEVLNKLIAFVKT